MRGLSWILVGLVATPALAQEAEPEAPAPPAAQTPAPEAPAKDPKLAKKWKDAGDKLIAKGDQLAKAGKPDAKTQYDNAVTAYGKAIEAGDDPAVVLSLVVALDKAGNTGEAIKTIKKLAATPNLKPDLAKKIEAKADELSMKVGMLTLQITPEGTQISIDGEQAGEAPMTEPMILTPGTHKISLTAGGFLPKELELKIEAGSESERKIALEVAPVVAKPVEVVPEQPPPPPHGPSPVPLFIGGGATVGLGLIMTVTGIIAVSEHSTFTDPKTSAADREDARGSGKTFAAVTDVCLVGALAAGAFTAYWYFFRYKPQARAFAERKPEAKLDFAPWVQPQAGGLAVAGSF